VFVVLFYAAFYVFLEIVNYLQTPEERAAAEEQARANKARKAETRQMEASANAAKRELCRRVRICREYGQARQQCAVAGNFDACIQIKMGAEASRIDSCSKTDSFAAGSAGPGSSVFSLARSTLLRGINGRSGFGSFEHTAKP
jgi:hypothetical protein